MRTITRMLAAGAGCAVVVPLLTCPATAGPATERPAAERAEPARVWVTSPTKESRRLRQLQPASGGSGDVATVEVDVTDQRQEWWGTGAALTDSALGLMRGRPATGRMLYGDGAHSAQLNLLRLPLSSTDLSARPWSWSWRAGESRAPRPAERAVDYVRGTLLRRRPDLRVLASPWSAPPSMKASGTLRGGALARGSEGAYADLLGDQASWAAARGVPFWAMTAANEPGHTSDYPSMRVSASQEATVGRRLASRLEGSGTQVWAHDHNWSQRRRADAVLAAGEGVYDAAAFHCYQGRPARMTGLAVPRLVTECTGERDNWTRTFWWDAEHLVAGAVRAGSSGLLMWSLALNSSHGPVDRQSEWGCKACRGLLTVTPHRIRRGPEFYTLAHLSRAALPGWHAVGVRADHGLTVAAFRGPDGEIGVFGHNGSGQTQTVRVRAGGTTTQGYDVRAGELVTLRLSP